MNKQIVNYLGSIAVIFALAYWISKFIEQNNKHKEALADKAIEMEKVKNEQKLKEANRKLWSNLGTSFMNAASKIPSFIGLAN